MKPLYELVNEVEKKYARQREIFDACDRDAITDEKGQATPRPVTSAEFAELNQLSSEISDLEKQIAEQQQAQAMRASLIERQPASKPIASLAPTNLYKSIGDRFVHSDLWRNYQASIAGVEKGIRSPAVKLDNVSVKTLITSQGASGGSLVAPDRVPAWDFAGWLRPLSLMDIVSVIPTQSDNVSFVYASSVAEVASPVAEGASKPESEIELTVVNSPVQSIPHWVPVTRRALDDNDQMRGMIDTLLINGVRSALENQMLNGSGTGVNLRGVYNHTGVQDVAFENSAMDTARIARTAITLSQHAGGGGATPTAYVMHPNDWMKFELAKDEVERYYGVGPFSLTPPRLWGLPVIESEFAEEGSPLIGDWRLALLFDREAPTMYVTDSHADYFIKNIIAILVELRAGFGLHRPSAFAKFAMAE